MCYLHCRPHHVITFLLFWENLPSDFLSSLHVPVCVSLLVRPASRAADEGPHGSRQEQPADDLRRKQGAGRASGAQAGELDGSTQRPPQGE